jgi:hypothetical protein
MDVNTYTCRAGKAELFGDGGQLAVKLWGGGCEEGPLSSAREYLTHRRKERHEDTTLETTWRTGG